MPAPATGVKFEMVYNGFPRAIEVPNMRAEIAEHALKERIAEEARRRVRVKTGETRDSIEVTDEGVEVGGAAPFLEYGTRKMPAYPFLGPAVEASKLEIEGAFAGLFVGVGRSL